MSPIILPRGYLSYSQLTLWNSSPDSYRKQYYFNGGSPTSAAMTLGSQVATLLEGDVTNHPVLSRVPRGDCPEYALDFVVDGVRCIGRIDSYDSATGNFYEYKTGVKPWSKSLVRKHLQLDMYALGLDIQHSENKIRSCDLVWIQTEKTVSTATFGGILMEGDKELILTGKIESFPRVISENDKAYVRNLIVTTAAEISADYQQHINNI